MIGTTLDADQRAELCDKIPVGAVCAETVVPGLMAEDADELEEPANPKSAGMKLRGQELGKKLGICSAIRPMM